MCSQQEPNRRSGEVKETEGFAGNIEDVREADFRLAKPLHHRPRAPTARGRGVPDLMSETLYIFRTASTAYAVVWAHSALPINGLRPHRLQAAVTSQLRIPSLTPSQSLCSIPSLSIAASCLVRFQLLLLCAERDSRQEPPLTSTTSVAWPEPGKFESQTGLARHESVPSGSVPAGPFRIVIV